MRTFYPSLQESYSHSTAAKYDQSHVLRQACIVYTTDLHYLITKE